MSSPRINLGTKTDRLLAGAILLFVVLLIVRVQGVYPVVFGDEYTYSRFSRLIPFSEANRPGYIYYFIYRSTNYCGEAYLSCARILNVLFFVASAPFIYLISLKVVGRKTALLISLLVLVGPQNTYTAYFMPEALYFLGFWIFAWMILFDEQRDRYRYWVKAGLALAVLSLVKPHALFLIPGFILYSLFCEFRLRRATGFHRVLVNLCVFVSVLLLGKFILGFLIAGPVGVTLLGSDYSGAANVAASGEGRYVALAKMAAAISVGHVLGLALMSGVAMAILVSGLLRPMSLVSDRSERAELAVFTVLILGGLILLSIVFTAAITGQGPYETVDRLHLRYYNFALPLLLILSASYASDADQISDNPRDRLVRWCVGVILIVLIIIAVITRLAPFYVNFVDNPDLSGASNKSIAHFYGFLSVSGVLLWMLSPRKGARLFIYLIAPVLAVATTVVANKGLRQQQNPSQFDRAGIMIRQFLEPGELNTLVVVGEEPASTARLMFHLDSPRAEFRLVPNGSPLDASKLPATAHWLLTVGDYSVAGSPSVALDAGVFRLYSLGKSIQVDFTEAGSTGRLSAVAGLSGTESFGAWSDGNTVKLTFKAALPDRFDLKMVAKAFGPNVGKPIRLDCGSFSTNLLLDEKVSEQSLGVENPDRVSSIVLTIPAPTSPSEIGAGNDRRRLGIGLASIEISQR